MHSAVSPILCILTASFAVATETVVGVAGRRVTLPCSAEAESKGGVCWGRGKPSLFACHNALLITNGVQVTHRASYRYSLPSEASAGDVSMAILHSRQADSGFYHCRVQVPGLFNDHIYKVHLIIVEAPEQAARPARPALTESFTDTTKADPAEAGPTEAHPGDTITDATEESGSGEAWDSMVEPVVALVKRSQQSDLQRGSLWGFIGSTFRLSFIIFIPALLLTVGYRLMRSQQRQWNGRRIPSDLEDNSL
ncbi:hepatitis A virus cellular receptor 1 homolog isoform X2 [Gadus chalcogrammus]|uniref:hepatitis A virus cellular receptor 1 homolog isoform X2 n=1 Tax=Gadus chalcogrammus TaxID=1042646 RepID=UPI0024C3F1AD|nr:hepatitis A virus cellular receptor 1 homolog isoform X2 [Gadus chalcogrammus]